MSNRRDSDEAQAVMVWLGKYYHYPVLFVLVLFAFWNRIRNWSNFVVGGDIFFSGNDPYYHLRQTEYTVSNFPFTMPFDPGTHFPFGTSVGQFGTLFDQLIALAALLVGLGNPSEELVRQVFLLAPPFFAIPIVIVAYFIGRRLGGRFGGLVSASIVAFAPDRLLQVSVAGNVQHHSAEALFMGLGVLGVMVALTVAEREKPVYELLLAREFDALRGTIGWSMLAGLAIALYLWTWPPGVFLYGILGAFFVVHLSLEHIRGRSPEHAAFAGTIALTTAGLLQLPLVQTFSLSATQRSPVQVGMALGVAAGIVFLAWLSREVDSRDVSPLAYPAAVAGSIVVALGAMALLLPDVFGFFVGEVDRVLGFITSPGTAAGTIGEAQPIDTEDLVDSYKLAGFTAIGGAALLLARQFFDDEPRGEHLLIVVWGAFILAATLTQLRFEYYMTLVVGALNGALAGYILSLISPSDRSLTIESYQVFTVAAIVLVVIVPMFLVSPTVIGYADDVSHPGESVQWDESLEWLEGNTPEPGLYGNPDGEAFDMTGEYKRTDDFDYPAGTYGVLSWWDYGHYITTQANRIPNANPFQEGAREAADFLLAQDEDEAMDVLADLDDHEDAKTQYVMVDWKMAHTDAFPPVTGKFFAPPDFHSEYERSDFYTRMIDQSRAEEVGIIRATETMVHKQPYYDSMVNRLYHYHGSAQEPQPYVLEWQGVEQQLTDDETFVSSAAQEPTIQFYDSIAEAQEAAEDPNVQLGGIGPYPEERVPALEHFRLVHQTELSALQGGQGFDFQRTDQNNQLGQRLVNELPQYADADPTQAALDFLYDTDPAWTKTFERVPGATIEGTGPEGETVLLTVELAPENGTEFTYTQEVEADEDGYFETTVPYSTTGADEYGVEAGYTNSSVEALGPYQLSAPGVHDGNETLFIGEVDVTEGQVLDEEGGPDPVELEPFDESDLIDFGDDEEGETEDDEESTTEDDTDGTDDDGTDDGSETDETNGGEEQLDPPEMMVGNAIAG